MVMRRFSGGYLCHILCYTGPYLEIIIISLQIMWGDWGTGNITQNCTQELNHKAATTLEMSSLSQANKA